MTKQHWLILLILGVLICVIGFAIAMLDDKYDNSDVSEPETISEEVNEVEVIEGETSADLYTNEDWGVSFELEGLNDIQIGEDASGIRTTNLDADDYFYISKYTYSNNDFSSQLEYAKERWVTFDSQFELVSIIENENLNGTKYIEITSKAYSTQTNPGEIFINKETQIFFEKETYETTYISIHGSDKYYDEIINTIQLLNK